MIDLMARRVLSAFLIFVSFLLPGCASMYFRDAGPAEEVRVPSLSDLQFSEYWAGIVFNGEKIGYSRFQVKPSVFGDGTYEVNSEARLAFHFLMFDKKMALKSMDIIQEDLSIRSFQYETDMDGSVIRQKGSMAGGKLVVEVETGGELTTIEFDSAERIHPTGVIVLYPLIHGLEVGKSFRYMVYDGEIRKLAEVRQEVLAYEESDLFSGKAFKVRTRLRGQKVTTWIDRLGRPVLEMSLGGVFIAGLENEKAAKRYLAEAALSKKDVLVDFSLIRLGKPLDNPRKAVGMEIILSGIDNTVKIPSAPWQECSFENDRSRCRILRAEPGNGAGRDAVSGYFDEYLKPTVTVQSANHRIGQLAEEITRESTGAMDQIERLVAWMDGNIKKQPVDVISALDVLRTRSAECQGHAFLYTAFARALGIPTRVVNGIVYSEEHKGFLYHTWAESVVGGRWIPVDPTFGQVRADATHVKFLEGEELSDLTPLIDLIGRIRAEVTWYETSP